MAKRETGGMYDREGSFYEDFFLKKGICFLGDYGFDGIHLADGLCRPRLPLQWSEYSEDMLEQAGIEVPAECTDPSAYVLENHRTEWIQFCTERWMAYREHVVNGAPTISIIDVDANAGFRQTYEDRKMVHHAFRALLMTVAACNRNRIPLRPLFLPG